MDERYCLTCRYWARSLYQRDVGYCQLGEMPPVNRIRGQFECCDKFRFVMNRKPCFDARYQQSDYHWGGKTNADSYEELIG